MFSLSLTACLYADCEDQENVVIILSRFTMIETGLMC